MACESESRASSKTHIVKLIRQPPESPFREWLRVDLGCGFFAEGYSRGADKTFLHLPQLKLGLDAGLACGRQPRTVLLTHTHSDHSSDLAYIAKRNAGCDIFCPKESVQLIENYIQTYLEMNLDGEKYDRKKMPFILHGVSPGEVMDLPLDCGGGQFVIEIFKMFHSCPCVGYGISRKKKRLAQRLKGFSGKEIASKRASGEIVDEEFLEPLFAFNGDTSIEAFTSSDHTNQGIFKYPVIITECSFYPICQEQSDREKIEMKKVKHTAFEDLSNLVIKQHPEITFVLIHASCRHNTTQQILNFLQSQLNQFPNIIGFINNRSNT